MSLCSLCRQNPKKGRKKKPFFSRLPIDALWPKVAKRRTTTTKEVSAVGRRQRGEQSDKRHSSISFIFFNVVADVGERAKETLWVVIERRLLACFKLYCIPSQNVSWCPLALFWPWLMEERPQGNIRREMWRRQEPNSQQSVNTTLVPTKGGTARKSRYDLTAATFQLKSCFGGKTNKVLLPLDPNESRVIQQKSRILVCRRICQDDTFSLLFRD